MRRAIFQFPQSLRHLGGALLLVTAATAVNNLIGFVVQVVAARNLSPEGFGVLSLCFSLALLVGTIGDLGLGLTAVRLFSERRSQEEKRVLLGSILLLRIAIFFLLLLLSVLVGRLLPNVLGVEGSNWLLFSTAVITGGFIAFWIYLQSLFRCYKNFATLSVYTLLYSGLRILALPLTFVLAGQNPLAWLLATYTLPTMLLLFIGLAPRARGFVVPQPPFGDILQALKQTLAYTKWVALSSIAYTAIPYAAQSILAVRASAKEVGLFAAGLVFAMVFSMLNTSVRSVLFPEVSALEGKEQIAKYLRRVRRIAPYYISLSVLIVATLAIVQQLFLGEEYQQALPVFLITSFGFLTTIFLGLGTMLIHTMKEPKIDALVNVVRIALAAMLVYTLAPMFGASGAAIGYVGALLGGEMWMLWYVRRRLG